MLLRLKSFMKNTLPEKNHDHPLLTQLRIIETHRYPAALPSPRHRVPAWPRTLAAGYQTNRRADYSRVYGKRANACDSAPFAHPFDFVKNPDPARTRHAGSQLLLGYASKLGYELKVELDWIPDDCCHLFRKGQKVTSVFGRT